MTSTDPIRILADALREHRAPPLSWVVTCLGCFALSPRGSQWAWGVEDRGLCGECAREWREAGGEMGPLVWGRAS